jgi:hypothetical protein
VILAGLEHLLLDHHAVIMKAAGSAESALDNMGLDTAQCTDASPRRARLGLPRESCRTTGCEATVQPIRRYFAETSAPSADDAESKLWNDEPSASTAYSEVVLEQYKLYVEMADRVSGRRSLANTFFLTLNTAVFTAIGVFWKDPPNASPVLGLFPLFALLLQCLVWFWIIRSYRQLNAGKWAVVGAMERRLPASPWWSAEWAALGEGKDPSRYWPLSHVEQWVPFLFAVAYIGGFVAILVA